MPIHQAGPCQADGRHRLAVAGIIAALGAIGAVAAVFLLADRNPPAIA